MGAMKFLSGLLSLTHGDAIDQQCDVYGNLKITAGPRPYETVAASQTAQVLGGTGAIGDEIDGVLVIPENTSPGAVTLLDGAGALPKLFEGGTDSVTSLIPFYVPLGARSVTGAWKITTGAAVHVIAFGRFAA